MDARQRAKVALRVKRETSERGNPYRFSKTFISRMTVILCIAIVVIPGIGIIYGVSLGSNYDPVQGTFAGVLTVVGFVVPLVAAAVLGGEAIHRGGGFVGFLFAAGLVAGPTGSTLDIPWLAIIGYAALGIGVLLFFVIGFRAKVPIWIGRRNYKLMSWNDPDDPDTTYT